MSHSACNRSSSAWPFTLPRSSYNWNALVRIESSLAAGSVWPAVWGEVGSVGIDFVDGITHSPFIGPLRGLLMSVFAKELFYHLAPQMEAGAKILGNQL
jgi:hypothetical protein